MEYTIEDKILVSRTIQLVKAYDSKDLKGNFIRLILVIKTEYNDKTELQLLAVSDIKRNDYFKLIPALEHLKNEIDIYSFFLGQAYALALSYATLADGIKTDVSLGVSIEGEDLPKETIKEFMESHKTQISAKDLYSIYSTLWKSFNDNELS